MHLGLQKGPRTKASREAKEFLRTPPGWGKPDCQARTLQQPEVQLLLRGSEALRMGQARTSTQNTCLPFTLGKFKERVLYPFSYPVHIKGQSAFRKDCVYSHTKILPPSPYPSGHSNNNDRKIQ